MDEPTFQEIDIAAYRRQFADDDRTPYLLLDVREVDEYQAGHLPGAINIPLSLLQMRVDEVGKDKPIVLVCNSGGRSAMAAEYLARRGYGDLYNLIDGTMGWSQQGLPLENE